MLSVIAAECGHYIQPMMAGLPLIRRFISGTCITYMRSTCINVRDWRNLENAVAMYHAILLSIDGYLLCKLGIYHMLKGIALVVGRHCVGTSTSTDRRFT